MESANTRLNRDPNQRVKNTDSEPPTIAIIVAKNGINSQILTNLIGQKIPCQCRQMTTQQHLSSEIDLAMIDCHNLTTETATHWLQQNLRYCAGVALFNVPADQNYEQLIEWPKMNGVFYDDVDESNLMLGIARILSGDLWLPRSWLTGHLESSRKTHPGVSNVTLTKRETEILRLMKFGDTNAVIGEKLGMRENTVKSHLYKVYRKIGASNRVDAGNWARINID